MFLWANYIVRDPNTGKLLRLVEYIDGIGVSPISLTEQAWVNLNAAINVVNERFFARAGIFMPS